MKNKITTLLICLFLLAACAVPLAETPGPTKVSVVVSILPQAFFVEKIAGGLVQVQAMTGSGDDPHTYEPNAQQMRTLADADLYLSIGVEFEAAWLPRFTASNPGMEVRDVSMGIERIPAAEAHSGHADEGELDPHTWLSPSLVKQISANIADALVELDPDNASTYQSGLAAWQAELDQLDADISAMLAGRQRDQFMIIHPALGYFAKEYGLEMLPVETGGQEPGPEELAQLLDAATAYQVSTLFVQRGVNQQLAQSIAAQINVDSIIEIDPLAADWTQNMRSIAAAMAEALR